MKQAVLFLVFIIYTSVCSAQTLLTPEQYIATYKDLAIKEMKRVGVPAAITLAQGLLETENGNSELVKKSNNHFGIKCKSNWTGESVTHDDDALGECFRSYKNAEESYQDHSNFLHNSPRYSFLFRLDVKDYKGWAYGLKKAGYATNPSYPQILIKNIEQFNLQQYTLAAAGEVPVFDPAKIGADSVVKNNIPAPTVTDLPPVSDNIIYVNGSKCVYAGKGTSLLAIATKNNITLNKLLSCNEQAEDGLLPKNQFVFLEKKSKTGDKDFYTAKGGETLYDIAQKNGIQLQAMLDYNKLWGNEELGAGTIIYLKPGLFNSKPAVQQQEKKTHIVAAKEGLYSIAKKYGVTVQQLKEWNNLQSDALRPGQELIILK